jgi:uncharacterized protein YdeI (YjbR/CyaY-like superfamily)
MQDSEQWANELSMLASIIVKASLEKSIKWGSEVYTYQGKNVISYGGFRNYFALWFYNGVFLKDPYGVLVNAQEGKTKSLRQWRFTSSGEIDEKKILEYIEEAIEIENKGLKIQPARFLPVTPSDWFSQVLKKDKTLKAAFEKLTPGRQKEYILFLEEAKQESTKVKRLMKVSPMIMKGLGLNDKYRP